MRLGLAHYEEKRKEKSKRKLGKYLYSRKALRACQELRRTRRMENGIGLPDSDVHRSRRQGAAEEMYLEQLIGSAAGEKQRGHICKRATREQSTARSGIYKVI